MADHNTLREFLVRVRYQTDQASMNSAMGSVQSFSSALFKLGAIATAAVTAVAYATIKYADNMNSIYLMTQRLGMGIKQFKAISSAAAELGDSVEGMQGSMKGFASFIRQNPFGSIAFMQGINKDIKATDTNDVKLQKLSKTFQEEANDPMKQAVNIRKAAVLGISEDSYLSMANTKFQELQKKHLEALKTGEFQTAGKKANEFEISKDLMANHFDAGMTKLMILPMEKGKDAMDLLSDHTDTASKSVENFAQKIDRLSTSIFGDIKDTITGKDKIDTHTPEYKERKKHRHWDNKSLGQDAVQILNSVIPNSERKKLDAGMQYFTDSGLSIEESAAIMANFKHESRFDVNATGDNGKAFGIGQWHPDRQANYKKLFGSTMQGDAAMLGEDEAYKRQLKFARYELDHSERGALALMRSENGTARISGEIVADKYERHGLGRDETIARGNDAQRIANQYNQNITINGITEPEKVKRKISELASRNTAAVHL